MAKHLPGTQLFTIPIYALSPDCMHAILAYITSICMSGHAWMYIHRKCNLSFNNFLSSSGPVGKRGKKASQFRIVQQSHKFWQVRLGFHIFWHHPYNEIVEVEQLSCKNCAVAKLTNNHHHPFLYRRLVSLRYKCLYHKHIHTCTQKRTQIHRAQSHKHIHTTIMTHTRARMHTQTHTSISSLANSTISAKWFLRLHTNTLQLSWINLLLWQWRNHTNDIIEHSVNIHLCWFFSNSPNALW